MKRLLLPLLATIALPTAVHATNYVECEAIYQVIVRQQRLWEEAYFQKDSEYKKAKDRAMKDYQKRGCFAY